jgi:hypothetical protein
MNKHVKMQAVFGRVVTVTNLNDDMYSETTPGTLRHALANAQDFDIIRFSGVTPGNSTVELYDRLIINKSITIEGGGITITRKASWTTVDGSSQLLRTVGNYTDVIIHRVHFKSGRTTGPGAAIDIYKNRGSLTLESCIFSDNQTNNWGGAINIDSALGKIILNIKGCTFYGNTGYGGGAICTNDSGSTLTLTGNLFYGNADTNYGRPIVSVPYVISNGYNTVDVPLGTGGNQSGWNPAPTDKTFTDLSITGIPLNTATFTPVSGLSIIPSAPEGFPSTDFYGNARTFPGAPGAVK